MRQMALNFPSSQAQKSDRKVETLLGSELKRGKNVLRCVTYTKSVN